MRLQQNKSLFLSSDAVSPLSSHDTKQLKIPKGVLVGTLFQVVSPINSQTGAGEEVYQVIPDCYSDIQETDHSIIIKPFAGTGPEDERNLLLEEVLERDQYWTSKLENKGNEPHSIRVAQKYAEALVDLNYSYANDKSLANLSDENFWAEIVNRESITLSKAELAKLASNYPNHTITITPKFLAQTVHAKTVAEFGAFNSTCKSATPEECFAKSLALTDFFTSESTKLNKPIQIVPTTKASKNEIEKVLIGVIPNEAVNSDSWKPLW